ncbi:hypothetical protein NsoK4_06165 [Nitrosopumilus sp. K4]|uniref:hypothetical protein n=1 Tax=Nitrosopumilus sp. K4 TaxID=2795383 RepID=UPI001BACB9A3|nr:hypothetical protein [Nitrosopumilus sp. K4]QUC64031.1 hypothetical protein NsoK4_06165 [Nitrosopumilus sp. K4]
MDENLMKKIQQKLEETISNKDEIKQLAESLSSIDDSKPFLLGLVVGRLYNAFYYQSKRILNREPTKTEFDEFLKFLKSQKTSLENLW